MELDERQIAVRDMDDEQLRGVLDEHGVGLTVSEVRRIAELIGRDPTLVELHIFNVEWSEHCSYKSSRASLRLLPTEAPNVMLGPQEDAGIVFFTEHEGRDWGIVIAHESHNHPSQILPNEGAATGIGGIVRDVDCMGARVFGTADPLRFGEPDGEHADRTRWIVRGVVDGIWQYGNALGVPNLAGDIYFDETFDDNCLVNVVAVGLVAEDEIIHSAVPPQAHDEQYVLLLVGKPTDDSGFGGSAFASKILDEEEQAEDRGAVQVPDPFLKNVLAMRKANEAVRERARERGITIGMKDIGGGGLACGSSEITAAGDGFGVDIDLEQVHVGLEGLLPETIMCAETQERYVLAVPADFVDEVLEIYNADWDLPNVYEGACARVIGRVTEDGMYTVRFGDAIVTQAPVEVITSGISYDREEQPQEWTEEEPQFDQPADLGEALLTVLGSRNVCSREYVYRAYDVEVQGNAVLRPGEAGAGVCRPLEGCDAAVALSVDGNPRYGRIDPYWGGANAVAEAMRNVAAVGAVPQALTDCLNFGNPEKPEQFWQFRQGVRGVADAAANLWLKGHEGTPVPVISGNVSFYNESATGSSVAPSPIIACLGVMDDYSKAATAQLKRPGDAIYLLGAREDELGGSAYYDALGLGLGATVPRVDWAGERARIYAVTDAIDDGLVAACQDISDGGLAVALAEMIMGPSGRGNMGADADIAPALNGLRPDRALFTESSGFVVEVRAGEEERFEALCADRGVEPIWLGEANDGAELKIGCGGEDLMRLSAERMAEEWTSGLARLLQ
ncbi:MAG: phosphoribosylformylglycinamidine synthase subunit PurL [Armatimonadota bacterium]|nr:phosphoribosylformylglycinamidine synthase subunit PurL [Armatimonadota bacterium]